MFTAILAVIVVVLMINLYMILSTVGNITTVDKLTDDSYDYVVVLGAGYRDLDTPSLMLEDRIVRGVQAHDATGTLILMSGDSRYPDQHDETTVMKRYAIKLGVKEEDILCDNYGLSTYETMWRAKNVYGAEKVIVITQRFHLNRSVYIAKALGLKVTGISADIQKYSVAKIWYNIREMAARVKDFGYCLMKPEATFTE